MYAYAAWNVDAFHLSGREPASVDLSANEEGLGRELFAAFRRGVSSATEGASVIL